MTNFSSPGLSATLSERGTIKHNSVLEFVTSINYPPRAAAASKTRGCNPLFYSNTHSSLALSEKHAAIRKNFKPTVCFDDQN